MIKEQQEAASITMRSNEEVRISHLVEGEAEKLESALLGLSWIRRGSNGRLETMAVHHALKGPADDEDMLPFWRPVSTAERTPRQLELFELGELRPHSRPVILIEHICGYDYSPERYREEAAKLESWGFECLRSRRGPDGTFWEIWYLYDLLGAQGALKEAVEWKKEVKRDEFGFAPVLDPEFTYTKIPEEKRLDAALFFLQCHGSFGSLSLGVQRMGLSPD